MSLMSLAIQKQFVIMVNKLYLYEVKLIIY